MADEKKLRSGNISSCIFLLFLFFTANSLSFAQVKFSAVCPDSKIGRNEYLQVQYIVENASNVEQIVPPSFKNFSVISGPNQQSSTSVINGAYNQSVALEFILKPTTTGKFILPPATAKVNGKMLRSNSISVQVTNNSSGHSPGNASLSPFGNMFTDVLPAPSIHQYDDYILRKGESLTEKIKKNLFVKLDVNKTSCYVGEPIIATYKLYTRLKSESNLTKAPSFNGFSVSEIKMPNNYTTTTEKYNGREYSVYTLRKVQLYPLQPGNVELDPIEVENHITFIKAEYANTKNGDIFYDMMRNFVDATTPAEGMEEQKITLQSKPLSITVNPLPPLNQPKDFKGAVGSFTISAAVEKNSITTDEAGNLTVSIWGNGNMPMINVPAVIWPAGMEAFDPKSTENIDNTSVPLKGQKIFRFPFTVSAPGTYTIPAIPFSYFDITRRNFQTLLTKPLTVEVKKGSGNRPAIVSHLNTSPVKKSETPGGNHLNWFWLLPGIGFFVAALVIWVAQRSGKKDIPVTTSIPNEDADQKKIAESYVALTQNPLDDAEKMLWENDNNFYYTLHNCLKKYLSAKLNFAEADFSRKKINELLDKHNVGVGTTLMLSSLLEEIELYLYAPASSVNQMQGMYGNAVEVIALLDKQIS